MIAELMSDALLDAVARFRGYADPRTGVSEELLPDAVGANGLAILTRPLEAAAGSGFVICRPPGPEQGSMHRLEALLARGLAAAGIPSLRIRRGYGGEGQRFELSLADCLAEAEDAVAALGEACGLERIGVVGEVLGAPVALVAANRLALPLAVLICPVVDGPGYLRDLFRRQLVAGFTTQFDWAARREPFEERLARGPTIVQGLRLTRAGYDALAALDLGADAREFRGEALVVGVSRSGEADDAVRTLAESFGGAGRPAAVELLRDPLPVPVGEIFLRVKGGRELDWRIDLDRELTRVTVDWAARVTAAAR
jgi:pimeloyl-ACP methyl ester carboxylesterase